MNAIRNIELNHVQDYRINMYFLKIKKPPGKAAFRNYLNSF